MTFTLPRAFFIPAAELNAVERREGDVVTYTWEKDGSILARGFSGRSNKPDFFHRYSTIEARTAAIDRFFESSFSMEISTRGTVSNARMSIKDTKRSLCSASVTFTLLKQSQLTARPFAVVPARRPALEEAQRPP